MMNESNMGLDLISRQAAIEAVLNLNVENRVSWRDAVIDTIDALPSAQPERKKGKWIVFDSDDEKYDEIKCDCCKKGFTVDAYHWTDIGFTKDDLKFCPNCGDRKEKTREAWNSRAERRTDESNVQDK